MRSIPTVIFFLLSFGILHAQGENNIWMMGHGMGLDCNYDPPRIIEHPNMQLNEAAATISDADGNLLFYTDNKTVWNAQHEVIENGSELLGGRSSHRGSLFIPFPDTPENFILFSLEEEGQEGRLFYSIIKKQNNRYIVIEQEKNIYLGEDYTEGIAAIKGECGQIWLIARVKNSTSLHVYRISADGIDRKPKEFEVIQAESLESWGGGVRTMFLYSYMYNKLIMTASFGVIERYDFNTSTGEISSPQLVSSFSEQEAGQSGSSYTTASLSYDENFLFVVENDMRLPREKYVFQFNMQEPTAEKILSSKKRIGSYQPILAYGDDMQIHPISKDIYIGVNSVDDAFNPSRKNPYLARIKRVNDTTYVVEDKVMEMPRVITRGMNFTNPTVVADPPPVTPPPLPDTTICSTISLSIDDSEAAYSSIRWSTGDTTAGIQIATAGDYWVEMDIDGCRVVDSFSVEIDAPEVTLKTDTTICDGADWSISLPDEYGYEWTALPDDSLLSTDPTYTITSSGDYSLMTISDDGCMRSDTISVDIVPPLQIDLGDDVTLCPEETVTIGTDAVADEYVWSTGETTAMITTEQAGIYQLMVTTDGCAASDSIRILRDDYCDCSIYIPTAVAPLSSSDNDVWRISSSCPLTDYQLQIYDRWGGTVHQSSSPADHWTATDVSSGVYTYTLRYSLQGRQEVTTGTVTVVR